ncbi:unnamed protein product [Gongylonema pulchrum]|uniref:TPR_REGION domain-containing protein n=1 Tax=Gongylonema pulchrum TaxID=637853 RepID=A0A183CUX7_9BILA|nr:unnamed protein product [Gongylonema pulchrum]
MERNSSFFAGIVLCDCQKILNDVFADYAQRQQKLFEVYYWLLKYYVSRCSFAEAMRITSYTDILIGRQKKDIVISTSLVVDFTRVQAQVASLWYVMGDYQSAVTFCFKAVNVARNCNAGLEGQVELLSVTAKILVFKKHFALALKCIRFALALVLRHPHLEVLLFSVLSDFTECLLKSDSVDMALDVSILLLSRAEQYYGRNSLHGAQAKFVYARAAFEYLHDFYGFYRIGRMDYMQTQYFCNKYAHAAAEFNRLNLDEENHQRLYSDLLEGQLEVERAIVARKEPERLHEILKRHRHAIEKFENLKANNAHSAEAYHSLGELYKLLKEYHMAEAMYGAAIAIKRKVYGCDTPEESLTLGRLAELHLKMLKNPAKALSLYQKCLQIGRPRRPDSFSDVLLGCTFWSGTAVPDSSLENCIFPTDTYRLLIVLVPLPRRHIIVGP